MISMYSSVLQHCSDSGIKWGGDIHLNVSLYYFLYVQYVSVFPFSNYLLTLESDFARSDYF